MECLEDLSSDFLSSPPMENPGRSPRDTTSTQYAKERIAQNVAELELEASSVSHLLGRHQTW